MIIGNILTQPQDNSAKKTEGARFWINDPAPRGHNAREWFGLVDEEAGGVIAYFRDENLAEEVQKLLEKKQKK